MTLVLQRLYTTYQLFLILTVIALATPFLSTAQDGGQLIYKNYCAGCHGPNLEGSVSGALKNHMEARWRSRIRRQDQQRHSGYRNGKMEQRIVGERV